MNPRIVSISILDTYGTKSCKFSPGTVTRIKAANGLGKSSILRALAYVFEGGLDASVIRNGCEKSVIEIALSNGVLIKERVAEFVPNEKLTFDVAEQPTDPEAYGHITLHRGRFVLQDNHDGTTTLTGSSWYTLHVRPRWYFDLWTRDMTRAVHLRVMNHVRQLSERR